VSRKPISNLPVVSELLERIVFCQLYSYLSTVDLLLCLQPAYRTHHSTESRAEVLTGIVYAVDDGDLSVLSLLDLSTAFDTVGHDILMSLLRVSFGRAGSQVHGAGNNASSEVQTTFLRGDSAGNVKTWVAGKD